LPLIKLILVLICLACALPTQAKRQFYEVEYQTAWCNANNGQMEYVLDDNSRVDCLLPEYAIEFDFADKWAEGVGQSLYYGLKTKRKPGIVLIMENNSDEIHLKKIELLSQKYGIKIWTMKLEELK